MGDYFSFLSKWKLIFLFIFLFLSFYLSITTAQVIIKEKIELNGLADNMVHKGHPIQSTVSEIPGLVMKYSGTLQIYHSMLFRYVTPLPEYSAIKSYFLKGDSVIIDSLISQYYLWQSGQISDNNCNPSQVWTGFYEPISNIGFDVGHVSYGDTIGFGYLSDIAQTGEPQEYALDSVEEVYSSNGKFWGWDLFFLENYDECYEYYFNCLFAHVRILKDYELLVNIEPSVLYPGDTASVVLKKLLLQDSSIVDFDTSQTFEIAKLEGCIWGNILVEDSLSSYFYGAHQPIKFVVDTSIAVIDSLASSNGIVKLGVGAIEPNQKEQLHNPVPFNATDCFVGPSITNLSPVCTEIDNALEIISPINEDIKWIAKVPEMPHINCEAIFKPLYPWPIKFEWEFQISKEYQRRSPEHSYICERISRSKFRGLSYSEHGGDFTNWLVPFDKDSGTFHFESLQPSKNKYDPLNYIYGCNGETDEWYDENEDIFTGGEIKISLVAKDNQTNKVLGKIKELPSGLILGENPDPAQIDNYIVDNIIKAIQLYESHNFQFEYDKDKSWPFNHEGWPIYGEPNGYGLMQLDNSPAATERQLWNWKANIDGAKYKFYTLIKSNNTDKFLDKHPDAVTEEMRLKCAYQKYNFFGWDNGKKFEHYYYKWDGKKWVVDEYITKIQKKYNQVYVWEKYGDGVYNIYTGLNQ